MTALEAATLSGRLIEHSAFGDQGPLLGNDFVVRNSSGNTYRSSALVVFRNMPLANGRFRRMARSAIPSIPAAQAAASGVSLSSATDPLRTVSHC